MLEINYQVIYHVLNTEDKPNPSYPFESSLDSVGKKLESLILIS